MRTLPIALVTAMLTISSTGYSQGQGLVGGKVDHLPATRRAKDWLGARLGQVLNPLWRSQVEWAAPSSNGHRVLVDPNSNRIMRVFN